MLGTPTDLQSPPLDSSRSALDFVYRLVILPTDEHANLEGLLRKLATAFGASAAGLATFPEGAPVCYQSSSSTGTLKTASSAWHQYPDLIERLPDARTALTFACDSGRSCLLTLLGSAERGGWLLWLEDDERTAWSDSEAALLALVGQTLTHRLMREEAPTPWAVQLDRSIRRQRMDAAARLVRRLSHDFGNILTGILGFSELALAHPASANSPLHDFLSEVHRGAKSGSQYTNRLRQFARRQAVNNRFCSFVDVLAELQREWRTGGLSCVVGDVLRPAGDAAGSPLSTGPEVRLLLHLPDDLPAVAVDPESLRQVLDIVLENAREAIAGEGAIDISARTIHVHAGEARELIGDVRPGAHLEIRIADNGSGRTPEAQRLLFSEPFFSTKPRKHGFGLAMAYGILAAHRGGIELLSRPEGGTIARLLVPVAAGAAPSF